MTYCGVVVAVGSPGIKVGVEVGGAIVEVPKDVEVCVGVFDRVGVTISVAVSVDVGGRVGEALGCGVAEGSIVSVDVGEGKLSTIGNGLEGRAVTIEGIEIA